MTRQEKINRNILFVFLSVPFLSSVMSTIHLVSMVSLGNPMAMAIALAITFELGSIVSFVALSDNILKRLKKELLYVIFGLLFIIQAFGNVYSSFDYMRRKLISDPTWLDGFREMFFNMVDLSYIKMILSVLIGLTIPIISLILLKSAVDYLSVGIEDSPNKEEPQQSVPEMEKLKSAAQVVIQEPIVEPVPVVVAEPAVIIQEPIVEPAPVIVQEPIVEPAPVIVQEPAPVIVQEPAPVIVQEPAPVIVQEPAPVIVQEPEKKK